MIHLVFDSHAISQPTLNSSSADEGKTSGFTLNWYLRDINGTKVTKKLPARKGDWKKSPTPAYKSPLLHNIIYLTKELRGQNMPRSKIMKKVIHQKLQTGFNTNAVHKCLMGQLEADEQKLVFSNIFSNNLTTNKTPEKLTDQEVETGYDLLHAVVFCPAMVSKMYTFVNQLLSVETSRTIILSIVNLFQSGVITDETTFTLTRKFYQVVADTLDLQYGNILLTSSTIAQIRSAIWNRGPFFTNHTDLVKKSLQESKFDFMHDKDISSKVRCKYN